MFGSFFLVLLIFFFWLLLINLFFVNVKLFVVEYVLCFCIKFVVLEVFLLLFIFVRMVLRWFWLNLGKYGNYDVVSLLVFGLMWMIFKFVNLLLIIVNWINFLLVIDWCLCCLIFLLIIWRFSLLWFLFFKFFSYWWVFGLGIWLRIGFCSFIYNDWLNYFVGYCFLICFFVWW